MDTLESVGVRTHVLDISRGPSVTRYEVQPMAGVKISRITSLEMCIRDRGCPLQDSFMPGGLCQHRACAGRKKSVRRKLDGVADRLHMRYSFHEFLF